MATEKTEDIEVNSAEFEKAVATAEKLGMAAREAVRLPAGATRATVTKMQRAVQEARIVAEASLESVREVLTMAEQVRREAAEASETSVRAARDAMAEAERIDKESRELLELATKTIVTSTARIQEVSIHAREATHAAATAVRGIVEASTGDLKKSAERKPKAHAETNVSSVAAGKMPLATVEDGATSTRIHLRVLLRARKPAKA